MASYRTFTPGQNKGLCNIYVDVIPMKACHSNEGMSYLLRYVILMKVCHTYEGMTQLLRLTLVVRCAAWSEKINSPYLVGLQLSKFPFSSEKSGMVVQKLLKW